MLEREFQGWVLDIAKLGGWRVWHSPMPVRPVGGNKFIPDPRGKGLPDLFLMHSDPPRLIFAELKREDGRVGEAQQEFFGYAKAVADAAETFRSVSSARPGELVAYRPVQAFVFRPSNRDLIEAVLLGPRRAAA